MTELKPPTKPVADWQAVRDAWVRDVERLVADVEGWCQAEGWATRVIPRKLRDSRVGEHVVPALLVQIDLTQLLFEPVTPRLPDGRGLIDLYSLPRYDDLASLVLSGDGWQVYLSSQWSGGGDLVESTPVAFDRDTLLGEMKRMAADARP